MPKKSGINFKKGGLTLREIKALDDAGAGYYENLIPARFLDPNDQRTTAEVKKDEKLEEAKSSPRKERE